MSLKFMLAAIAAVSLAPAMSFADSSQDQQSLENFARGCYTQQEAGQPADALCAGRLACATEGTSDQSCQDFCAAYPQDTSACNGDMNEEVMRPHHHGHHGGYCFDHPLDLRCIIH